ncbi:MAG: P-loop NTPase fold protein [Candidatus Methanoperedens sp.]
MYTAGFWSELIDEYMGSGRSGALVIIGPWGSGKTHIFKHEISPALHAHSYKFVYISLYAYGVGGKCIDDLIIEQYIGVQGIDADSKKGVKDLLAGAFAAFTGEVEGGGIAAAAIMTVGGALKKRFINELSDHVFCFDDIDRLGEKLDAAWSEINYLTEFKSRKVIILLDEKQLPGETIHHPNFEKNVWRSIHLHVPPPQALGHAIGLLDRDFAESLRDVVPDFESVVTGLNVSNIRTIFTALESVRRMNDEVTLISAGSFIVNSSKCALFQMIFLVSILMVVKGKDQRKLIEIVCGGAHFTKVRNLYSVDSLDNESEKRSENEVFIASLPGFRCDLYQFPFVVPYIYSGLIDVNSLSQAVASEETDYSKYPHWEIFHKLTERLSMDDAAYMQYFSDCVEAVKEPVAGYYELSPYYQIIAELLFDANHGAGNVSMEQLVLLVENGINHMIKGVTAGTHKIIVEDDMHLGRTEEALPDSIVAAYRRLGELARKIHEREKVLARLDGWELESDLSKLLNEKDEYSYPLFDVLGWEALSLFLNASNGKQLLRFNRIIDKRFKITGDVAVIVQERAVLQNILEYYNNYSGFSFKKVQCSIGADVVTKAISNIDKYSASIS